MSDHERKYRQNFKRCAGTSCVHKEKCERFHAREEALNLGLSHGIYIESKSCILNNHSELIIEVV